MSGAQGDRPVWFYIAGAVAVLALVGAAVSAYLASSGPDALTWERYASSAFGIAVLAAALMYFGRHRSK